MTAISVLSVRTVRSQSISAEPGVKLHAPLDANRVLDRELATSTSDDLSITAVGSLTLSTEDGPIPVFDQDILSLLTGSAAPIVSNVTVGDLEDSIIDPKTFAGYPYSWDGAPTPSIASAVAHLLKTSGFDLLARANGHALDFGIDGMRATDEALSAAGLVNAGTGLDAGLARSPRYYDEPRGRGRIALVSAASTFRPTSNALDAHGAAPGRPGVSGLETMAIRLVPPDQLKQLQQVSCEYRHDLRYEGCSATSVPELVTVLGSTFETTGPARYYTIDHRLNREQAQELLRAVRQGKANADFLMLALHSDQVADARSGVSRAPRFLEELAHAAIDGGTDMVVNTGPSSIGPIEIYRADKRPPRPIFYSLGNFCWSPGLGRKHGDSAARWSIITRTQIHGARLEVQIYPIDLSSDANHPDGWPRLADKALSLKILQRLTQLSAPYGTSIAITAFGSSYRGKIQDEGIGTLVK